MIINNYSIHKLYWIILTFFPAISNITGNVGTTQKIMHLFFITLTTLIIVVRKKNIYISMNHILFLTFSLSYMFIIVSFNIERFSYGDIGDLSRPVVYMSYFIIPILFKLNEEEFIKLFKFILYLLIFQIIFSSFVFIRELWPLVDIYKGRMSTDKVFFHFLRFSGTFGYPSDFSFYISFFIYYYFFYLVYSYIVGIKQKNIILILFILIFALILTISRGGIGTVIIMIFFILLYYSFLYKKIRLLSIKIFLVTIIVLIIIVSILLYINTEESLRYVNYLQLMNDSGKKLDGSTGHRIKEFMLSVNYFLDYFPFGPGPNRDELSTKISVVESFYGLYMLKWGLVGLLIYFFFIFYMIKISLFTIKIQKNISIKIFLQSFIVLMLSVILVFGFSSAVSDRFKGLPFFYLLAGYSYMLYKLQKDKLLKKD